MDTFALIRAEAERIDSDPMREACLRIVDEVEKRLAADRLSMWTFHTFSKWLKNDISDDLLQECIFLLSQKRRPHLLEMHFLFFDPADPDDIGQPIDDEDVAHAYSAGELIDPRTGQPVHEFEETLAPYFVVNPVLQANKHKEGPYE